MISRPSIEINDKLNKAYIQLIKLIEELNKRELSDEVVGDINNYVEGLNAIPDTDKKLRSELRKKQSKIIHLVEKEHKLVPKNHYRNSWLVLGMSVFGVPMGLVFSLSLDNMAFIGIGLPIGMAVGIALGSTMDKKALETERQLDIEIKY